MNIMKIYLRLLLCTDIRALQFWPKIGGMLVVVEADIIEVHVVVAEHHGRRGLDPLCLANLGLREEEEAA